MKRFVCFALICIILILGVGAAAEPAADLPVGYGLIEDVGGWIGAFCNEWNRTIGKNFKTDISFDPGKQTMIKSTMVDGGIEFTAEIDGIVFDVFFSEDGMEVLSMRIDIANDDVEAVYTNSRICAMIAVLCYEPANDRMGMIDLYSTIFQQYVDAYTEFVQSRQDDYSVTINGSKATHEFHFHYDGNTDYFSTDRIAP